MHGCNRAAAERVARHDPRLLDTLSDKSWILRDQRLYSFDMPCSRALIALADADTAAQARHAGEQQEIDRLASSSKRLAIWGREHDNEKLARQAKSMQRRVDKLKDEQIFVSRGSPWRLKLQGKALAADRLLAFENLQVRAQAEQALLFQINDLWLRPGDKVALLGSNGTGKSSLLRQCWDDVQQGEARAGWRYHPAARIAYYAQSLHQLADDATLLDALYKFAPVGDREATGLDHSRVRLSASQSCHWSAAGHWSISSFGYSKGPRSAC